MAAGAAAVTALPSVVAPLNYLAPIAGPLRTYAYDPPDGGPRFNGALVAHAMPIADARPLRGELSLDVHGFVLADHASAVRDFELDAEVRGVYYGEAERVLCALTGAARARVFDHTRRRRAPGRPPIDGTGGSFATVREPVGRVHADYTAASARSRLGAAYGEPEAAALARRRYAIYGLWRPLNDEPRRDAPIAVADARSVDPADLVPNALVYPDRRGETFAVLYNPRHRWFHFPLQRRDEWLVFKHFDSAAEARGLARAAPHTAFEDPTTPFDAPPRRSIELRAIALFDD